MDEFNHLIQQAVLLKTEQLSVDRRRFDSYPEWYQHSMFASAEVKQLRSRATPSERLRAAEAYKEDGNVAMAAGDFNLALVSYGNALGLFRWLENADPNWKKKAIDDRDISERRWAEGSGEQRAAADGIALACCLNLSLLYQRAGRWAEAVRAADAAIEMQPACAKAHYRKAQALFTPLSAGSTEYLLALKALKRAIELEPQDVQIRTAYNQLYSDIEKQKEKDNIRFKGFLQAKRSGLEKEESEVPPCGQSSVEPTMTAGEAYARLQDMESAAARHYDSGLHAEAAQLRATVERLRAEIDQHVTRPGGQRRSAEKARPKVSFTDEDSHNGMDETTAAEMRKAQAVARHFVTELTLREAKAMLRARGDSTAALIPRPDWGAGIGAVSPGPAGVLIHTAGAILICVHWISYQLRTRMFIFELLGDLLHQSRFLNGRLISAEEEQFFRERLIGRFSADMYALKASAAKEGQELARDTLLVTLMEQYEHKKGDQSLLTGMLNLSWGSWVGVFFLSWLIAPRLVKAFYPSGAS